MKTMLPLRHANLITLYGAGKSGGYCWIAIEFVDGESLKQVIQRISAAGSGLAARVHVAVHIARACCSPSSNRSSTATSSRTISSSAAATK